MGLARQNSADRLFTGRSCRPDQAAQQYYIATSVRLLMSTLMNHTTARRHTLLTTTHTHTIMYTPRTDHADLLASRSCSESQQKKHTHAHTCACACMHRHCHPSNYPPTLPLVRVQGTEQPTCATPAQDPTKPYPRTEKNSRPPDTTQIVGTHCSQHGCPF